MSTCPHDFKRTWRCEDLYQQHGIHIRRGRVTPICGKGRWVYRCKFCGCAGFALFDGGKSPAPQPEEVNA